MREGRGRKLESEVAMRIRSLGITGNLDDTAGHPPDLGKATPEGWKSGDTYGDDTCVVIVK